jgi:hypothetical protein
MLRRALARYRQVAPTLEWTAILVVIFFGLEGFIFFLEARNIPIGARLPVRPGAVILFMAAVTHGLGRAFALHPIWNRHYLNWLKATPWTSRKPLPMGPVQLDWSDGVFMAGLILLSSLLPQPRAMQLLNIFLISHLAALTLTLWLTKTWAFGYTAAFGLGLAVWLWHRPLLCLAVATLVYALAHEGLRRGFERFPWETPELANFRFKMDLTTLRRQAEPLGWPHERMMREIGQERLVSRLDAVLGCMLVSWWLFVLTSRITESDARLATLTLAWGSAVVAGPLGRLGLYVQGYQSPLSLWGRIMTLRLIIPGYDQVFVAPICTMLAGPICLGILMAAGVPLEISLSVATGLTVLVALIMPPRLRHWRLCGRHCIRHVAVQYPSNASNLVQAGS